MPGNEILNTPLCPPFLPFLLGHHENNQASARESWATLRRLDQAFNAIFFQGGSSSLTREILFSTLRNAIDGTMGEALIRSWCAEARMRPLPVGGGGSGWWRSGGPTKEYLVGESSENFVVFSFFFFLSRGVRGKEDHSAWGKLRVKISIPLLVFAYNLSILRRKWVYDYSYWWRTDLVKLKRGWKLYLEALTPLLGIVKGVPFTHESGNFDKTSTRRVYVRRRFKVPTFVEHVIHPSSEIEERNVRDKKAKHEETLPTFPASYKNFENSVLFSTRKYSQGLLNPPNSPQLLATTRK